jgi:hypothetical protein
MKTMLVIGNANSVFIKQYIENVLVPEGFKIILIQESTINPYYLEYYKNANILVEPFREKYAIPGVSSILGSWMWVNKIRKKYGEIDFVHIHGLNSLRGMIGHWVRPYVKKEIITIWGSELLQCTKKKRLENQLYYNEADCITVSTEQMRSELNRQYSHKYENYTRINRFGLSVFDCIDEISKKESREELCSHFGITDPTKIMVLIGYNGRPRQKLIELTQALKKIPVELQQRVVAIYTLTYGMDEKYYEEIQNEISSLKIEKVILKDYMNETETARLRCISDILLHAQPTDAFSASLQECLYAGGVVINGSWLHYGELERYGIKLIEYNNFIELHSTITTVLKNYGEIKRQMGDNKAILRKLSSQTSTAGSWKEIWENW